MREKMVSAINVAAPLLSVTVLNYNYAHYLPRCLDSILQQDFTNFEIILINDTSTDNSLEVIQPYLADPRVRLIDHAKNKGFVASLIEGCEESRGKYLSVISADDWVLDPATFRKQLALAEADQQIAFVYTAYAHFMPDGSCESIWRFAGDSFIKPGYKALESLLLSPFLLHSGTIIRKSAYEAVGGYETTYRYAVDTRMWLELCHVGKVAYLNEVLYAYHRHGTNMSRSNATLQTAIDEVLIAINSSYSKLPATEKQRLAPIHRLAQRRALLAFAIDDIFRDQYHTGWQYFRVAFQKHPIQTMFQRQTIIIALRTLFGRKGFARIAAIWAKINPNSRIRQSIENYDHRLIADMKTNTSIRT